MERRIDQKFNFNPVYNIFPFGIFICGYFEIATSVVNLYLRKKLKYSRVNIDANSNRVLDRIDYDINKAPLKEIVFCFIIEITMWLAIIFVIAAFPQTTINYPQVYGIPPQNAYFNFFSSGTLMPGVNFITRPAPSIGSNVGGAIEVVTYPGSVSLN